MGARLIDALGLAGRLPRQRLEPAVGPCSDQLVEDQLGNGGDLGPPLGVVGAVVVLDKVLHKLSDVDGVAAGHGV